MHFNLVSVKFEQAAIHFFYPYVKHWGGFWAADWDRTEWQQRQQQSSCSLFILHYSTSLGIKSSVCYHPGSYPHFISLVLKKLIKDQLWTGAVRTVDQRTSWRSLLIPLLSDYQQAAAAEPSRCLFYYSLKLQHVCMYMYLWSNC